MTYMACSSVHVGCYLLSTFQGLDARDIEISNTRSKGEMNNLET